MSTLKVTAAYDESPMAELPMDDEAACMGALQAAHAMYEDRDRWLRKTERIEILERAAQLVESRTEELARQAAREGGKPLVDSLTEVRRAVEGIRTAVRELQTFGGTEIPMGLTPSSDGRAAFTWREPRGVVLSISAFNHPFNLITHQVIPALAVGCPVVIKPSLTTPLSCKSFIDILHEAGAPEEGVRMVLCDNDVASKLVKDERISFLSFIGSAKVGWTLRSQLPPGAHCALEHGGAAPAIVDHTADLDDAVPLLVKGGFYHAGQVCVSVQRIYVDNRVIDDFLARFVPAVQQLRVGDPTEKHTDVGPLIAPREADRVDQWVKEAISGGAKLLTGGERLSNTTYAPTVLRDPKSDAKVSCDEVFGPVVAVYGYDDIRDAIDRANAPNLYFQASLFTNDLNVALDAHRRLKGKAIMVNDHTAFRVDWMPFGGDRLSGLGTGGIGFSMRDMVIERMVVFRNQNLH